MPRFSIYLLSWLLAAVSAPASGCRAIAPDLEDTAAYSAVFVGTVTGIHLAGFERKLLGVGDGELEGEAFTITNGGSEVRVSAVPTRVASGVVAGAVSVRLVGCTTALPALKERGLFFVSADGTSAITLWESSGQPFSKALATLGIAVNAL
jgi:hypothetical protein